MSVGQAAMILAAGFGTRMRPLTDTRPKPLIEVAGKPIIDHDYDALRAANVTCIVVNAHYLAGQIETWAAQKTDPPVIVSDERAEILDTGGGIVHALPLLGGEPFFVLNSDSFWRDRGRPALERLRTAWNADAMDCLLLLSRRDAAVGYDGQGDFIREQTGRLRRRPADEHSALAYMGVYLVHPRLFAQAPQGPFSMNLLWNRAIAGGRLHGIIHDGLWLHVGTPDAIGLAEAALRA
ncbi:nucleotidyltransferase family protein [Aestuariivirga sp.]|uniref:nucleotidyltransferase family protein n=1 Tax=Aestuariivirga sp. TaxID=2650926 RepID=UPI0039E6F0CD